MPHTPKYDATKPPKKGQHGYSPSGKYIIRLFDMFDGWLSASKEMSWEDAVAAWMKETANGTKNTEYNDGDYWDIFPAGTRMVVTPEFLGR